MMKFLQRLKISIISLALALASALPLSPTGVHALSQVTTLSGIVTDSNNNGLQGWGVNATSVADSSIVFGTGTQADGSYTMQLDPGTYNIQVHNGNADSVNFSSQTIATDTVLNATVNITTNIFSGTLKDNLGNPMGGFDIQLVNKAKERSSNAFTDANGNFSVRAENIANNSLLVGGAGVTDFGGLHEIGLGNYNTDTQGYVDLTGGNVSKNLVMQIDHITVNVKDYNNNPVPNVSVQQSPSGWPNQSITTLTSGLAVSVRAVSSAVTDANGTAVLPVVRGSYYGQSYANDSSPYLDNICAVSPDNSSSYTCLYAPFTVSGDASLTLQPRPLAPTNLIANPSSGPTKLPTMSWTASSGASGYKVYRNGSYLTTVAGTTFVDSNDGVANGTEGTNTYAVSSLANGIESKLSNLIYVGIDHQAPTITYSLSPAPLANGWNSTNTTVTFTCADYGNPNTVCTSPVIVSTDTAGQVITGVATDRAGNTTSVSVTVKLDKTNPMASGVVLSPTTTIRTGNTLSVTADSSDAMSGVRSGEFYIDTDPGVGNGTSMTFASGKVSGQKVISGITSSNHTVYVRTLDNAGHWSSTTTAVFTFKK
jgi:hypothetical protein